MKTFWIYSNRTEAERIVLTAHQISVGFYKNNNFIVLPYNLNIFSSNIVIFPDLKFTGIPRFWEQSKKVDVGHKLIADNKKLVSSVLDQVQKLKIKAPQYEHTKKLWSKVEKEVVNEIYKILPQKKNSIKKLTIPDFLFLVRN